jgi:hypothetical protein
VVFYIVNPNADEAVPSVPALDYLMPDPRTTCSLGPDENNGHGSIPQLIADPTLDRLIPLPLDGLPINCIDESKLVGSWKQVGIPHLTRSPCVTLIMKAKERLSRHKIPLR